MLQKVCQKEVVCTKSAKGSSQRLKACLLLLSRFQPAYQLVPMHVTLCAHTEQAFCRSQKALPTYRAWRPLPLCNLHRHSLTHRLFAQHADATILPQPESAKTIYQRLGGRPAVLAAVELLYQKMLADARLSRFFVGVDMEKLMKHQARRLALALHAPLLWWWQACWRRSSSEALMRSLCDG